MAKQSFSWLHLSDLHLKSSNSWESDEVINGLLKDLRSWKETTPDAIIFSGDCVFGTSTGEDIAEQFVQFAEFIERIRNCFSPTIALDAVFIVPGNHDVERNVVTESNTHYLHDPKRTLDEIRNHLQNNSADCQQWLARLTKYRQFLKKFKFDHLGHEDPHLLWQKLMHDGAVSITGFNSAWSSCQNREKSKLWMAGDWQIGTRRKELKSDQIKIAVVHHPCNWLTEFEDPDFKMNLEQSFDIILHGHEHSAFVSPNSAGGITVSAGACYDRSHYERGYSFGIIHHDRSAGSIHLREWDRRGKGWVASNIANFAPNGVYTFGPLGNRSSLAQPKNTQLVSNTQDDGDHGRLIAPIHGSTQKVRSELLSQLKRRPLAFEPAHSLVRRVERQMMEESLTKHKIAWLVADWQMGKEGFIASAINSMYSSVGLENVYRLDCGNINEFDQIYDLFGSQIGAEVISFFEVLARIDKATIILDDIPSKLLDNPQKRANLSIRLKHLASFAPSINIIVTVRNISSSSDVNFIRLRPFEIDQIKAFLESHPEGKSLLRDEGNLEDILRHTEGLPAKIDRLIKRTEVLPLEDLLDESFELADQQDAEEIPPSLIRDIDLLFSLNDEAGKRVIALLKLLTVLKDGETYESIKRIYPRSPFHYTDVIRLTDLGLLESVEIIVTGNGRGAKYDPSFLRKSNKVLRIPRQVRDFVSSKISIDERDQIFNLSSEALFGGSWYEGKIRLRKSIFIAYRQSSLAGPGNELLVAQQLLQSAINNSNKHRINKYSGLAINYCQKLYSLKRFRDAYIASKVFRKMLDKNSFLERWLSCSIILGRTARMIGYHAEAIQTIEEVIDQEVITDKSRQASLYLNIAWCYRSLENGGKSIEYAKKVIGLSHNKSDEFFEAAAVIAKSEFEGAKLYRVLYAIYQKARAAGCQHASENIALSLARRGKDKKLSMKLIDQVLSSSSDSYNRFRAVIDKSELLHNMGKIGELSQQDQEELCCAYEYGCSQRVVGLMDRCHRSLWEYCSVKHIFGGMFRIFRFSSFIWCVSGSRKKEEEYIGFLLELKEKGAVDSTELAVEIEYLNSRITEVETISESMN